MADDKRRDDEVGLPLRPAPPPLGDPRVHPAVAPSFAPELPPDFRSRPVDASDAPPSDPPYEDASRRLPHGPPPPPSSGDWTMGIVAVAIVVFLAVAATFVLHRPMPPQAAQGLAGTEQTIELPPGQRLIHAEIGDGGQVYYRYAPLRPEEQLRSSTLVGRSSTGRPFGTIHFIERAAE